MTGGKRVCAVIPAAGAGSRMGEASGGISKALIPVGGVPIIIHTLRRFEECPEVDDIVVTTTSPDIPVVRALVDGERLTKVREIIPGGSERQDSVRLGFLSEAAKRAGIIVVHDGVRPFVTIGLIGAVIRAASAAGAAVAAVRSRDTVKIETEEGLETPARSRCWLAQTPQAFLRELLAQGLDLAEADGFQGTDDASLVERLGRPVSIVEGSDANLKITTSDDLRHAERFFKEQNAYHEGS